MSFLITLDFNFLQSKVNSRFNETYSINYDKKINGFGNFNKFRGKFRSICGYFVFSSLAMLYLCCKLWPIMAHESIVAIVKYNYTDQVNKNSCKWRKKRLEIERKLEELKKLSENR